MTVNVVDSNVIRTRTRNTWMSGNYARFATYLVSGAMDFLTAFNIPAGTKVLDVACGAGQTAIPMARKGVVVTGIDIASNLVEEARRRAQKEGLSARFDEGDAADLPYDDASFDIVFSLIGAMFSPEPFSVAAELARVCRPGGQIIMGNWTPSGFVGQMFRTIAAHVPPPPGVPSPVLWGDETNVRERLGEFVTDLRMTRRLYPLRFPFAPAQVVDLFRETYGPVNRAFAALNADGQAVLHRDLEQLWARHSRTADGTTYVEAEILHVRAIRS